MHAVAEAVTVMVPPTGWGEATFGETLAVAQAGPGIAALEVSALVPSGLVAVTVNVYEVPSVRPGTHSEDWPAGTEMVVPPGWTTTW